MGGDGTKGMAERCLVEDGDTMSDVVKVLIEDRLGGEDDGGEGRGLGITCG